MSRLEPKKRSGEDVRKDEERLVRTRRSSEDDHDREVSTVKSESSFRGEGSKANSAIQIRRKGSKEKSGGSKRRSGIQLRRRTSRSQDEKKRSYLRTRKNASGSGSGNDERSKSKSNRKHSSIVPRKVGSSGSSTRTGIYDARTRNSSTMAQLRRARNARSIMSDPELVDDKLSALDLPTSRIAFVQGQPIEKKPKKPSMITLRKTEKAFDYAEFLDRHYKKIQPGIHKIRYPLAEFTKVITDAIKVFKEEPVLVDVAPPITIVGDIHGQYNDLINMFLLHGIPPQRRYLFLGDYVDRGRMSVEVAMLLLGYKVCYPNHVFLLRGNHECARVNQRYGFQDECVNTIEENGEAVWALFQRCFNYMPICGLIATKILCMHGGLSPNMNTFDEIRKYQKPIRNPYRGLINDMLWADPELRIEGWRKSFRGSGFMFGKSVLKDVCNRLHIDLVVRAHQLCFDGFWMSGSSRCSIITLFSAPMYTNLYRNAGTIMEVDTKLRCQFIAMVPESRSIHELVRKNNTLWDESIDPVYQQQQEGR